MTDWTEVPIVRVVNFAPGGNGCMLFFENGAFGLNAFQQDQFNPQPGDLFTFREDGTVEIRKPTE